MDVHINNFSKIPSILHLEAIFVLFFPQIFTILKLGQRKFQIGDDWDTCSVEDMYS